MKRLAFTPLAGAVALLLATAGVAVAASPHFIGTPTISQQGNSLVVNFKAAGLGNVPTANFTLSGTVNVSSRCYNNGNNKPQAANKQETINVSQSQDFAVRNGQTTGSFTITPLSTLDCPNGQHAVIESVSYDLTLAGQGLSFEFVSP